jgi:hypothetical protein
VSENYQGQNLCFLVTYQLISDYQKYRRQYRSEYIKALSESEVTETLRRRHGDALRDIREISLTGLWSSFERDLERRFQGD